MGFFNSFRIRITVIGINQIIIMENERLIRIQWYEYWNWSKSRKLIFLISNSINWNFHPYILDASIYITPYHFKLFNLPFVLFSFIIFPKYFAQLKFINFHYKISLIIRENYSDRNISDAWRYSKQV